MVFFKKFISGLIEEGHTVDIACNDRESKVDELYKELGCNVYTIDTSRSPIKKGNIKAIKQIKKIVEENGYDVVHCHTPIAAACTRLACKRFRKKGLKVVYTAHGFHFYKGAPFKNKLIFYPIEKLCSYFTDVLVTINKEDFALAQKKFKAKEVKYVPGVGIDTSRFVFSKEAREEKRKELGFNEDEILIMSVGELNQNKNQKVVIKALAELENQKVHYVIVGNGEEDENLQKLAEELKISNRVHLLGYRTDLDKLYSVADIYVHPSYREGLPVSLMEAMSSGLPCVASKIRGNIDLIENPEFLVGCDDYMAFAEKINLLVSNEKIRENEKSNNRSDAKKYDVSEIIKITKNIYGLE